MEAFKNQSFAHEFEYNYDLRSIMDALKADKQVRLTKSGSNSKFSKLFYLVKNLYFRSVFEITPKSGQFRETKFGGKT